MAKLTIPEDELMSPGHMGCLGCGATLAMRYVLKAAGRRTILSIPACCWAVMPGVWPNTCLQVPELYTPFETTGASISGIRAALDATGQNDVNVIGFAGDGGTADIGIQALSGTADRNDDVLYIMYDNEAYMNTGIQRSGSTPIGAWTTTTPVGTTGSWEKSPKKNMVAIMAAHRIPYVATASVAYPEDLIRKVQKALTIKGTKFMHIFAPCPTGWKMDPGLSIKIAKEALSCRAFNLFEIEGGSYKINMKPKKTSLKEYLFKQGRFKHMPEDLINELETDLDRAYDELLRLESLSLERAKVPDA
ncbi:MAG: 3-methyl-2-oxobutanoate dehydrogenase subunit beta [Candidatus Thermoplasmatota archaeon]|nr:3-methyl-2-oxobutanoate dehydrogenase subunit beta [Candidatus Thermoplasmatota archaeon]